MEKPLVFMSYASPDREAVLEHHSWLERAGCNVWLDCKRILPGQDWDLVVNQALDKAALVLVFVSAQSVARRGYVQREIRRALERRLDQLDDDIFVIPILLDDAEPPRELRQFQFVKTTDSDFKNRLLSAIQLQLERLGHKIAETQERQQVFWTRTTVIDSQTARPARECNLEFLEFSSTAFPDVRFIGTQLAGLQLDYWHDIRLSRFLANPDMELDYDGIATLDTAFRDPVFRGKFMSVQGSASYFYAGAAHGGMNFITGAYLLEPFLRVQNLQFAFNDGALASFQEIARGALVKEACDARSIEPESFDMDWLQTGTKEWRDFETFTFEEKSLRLYFAPYAVAPYAMGPLVADIPYTDVQRLLRAQFAAALDI